MTNKKMNCHSRKFLSGISTLFPRPLRQRMSVGRVRGFTLLEILVVVVIIAVLATIAVSAYQKAVVKSRFSSLMPIAKTLAQGNENYYLRNGQYADDVSKLDIRATGNNKTQITLGNEDQHKYVLLTRDDMNNQLRMYQQKSKNFPGETHCEALINDTLANWLCRDALKGTLVGNKLGYTVYSLSPEAVGSLARTVYNQYGATLSDGDVCVDTEGTSSPTNGCAGVRISNGARCISGTTQIYACLSVKANHYAVCEGSTTVSCGGGSEYKDHSTCIGGANGACYWAQVSNYSVCEGESSGGCGSLSKIDDHSECRGNVAGSCNNVESQFGKYTNFSSCIGNADNTCTGSKFYSNSTCVANAVGACVGSTYLDSTSYCTGKYCPDGAASNTAGKVWHREEGWDDETESVLVDAPTE